MKLTKRSVVKNAGWIIGCRIVQSLMALIIGMLSARYLGPSNYGLISYASSVIAFVVPLAQLGLRNVLVEEIVAQPENEGEIIGTAIVISLVSSLFCVAGCISFVSFANAGEQETIIVCALYSISLLFQMLELIQYWYQAKLLSKYTSIVSLASYFICAAYKIFLLITKKNIYWFAAAYSLDFMIISMALLIIYRKLGGRRLKFSFAFGKKMFSRSKYYIVSSMMVTIFSQTDKIMIKMMLGNAETGFYSTAITCVNMTSFVFMAIIDSLRPVIFESRKSDYKKYERNMSLLYSVIIYMGLAQSVVFTVLAKPIVTILYGQEYLPTIPILQIIVWYTSFSYMGTVRNIWMLAENKQKYLWIINLSGAVLNIIGNFVLITTIGSIGAAISSVLTQFFVNWLLCFIIKPIRPTARLIAMGMQPKTLLDVIRFNK